MKLPRKVNIIEVGLRDGLQNERVHLPTAEKIQFAQDLVASGIRQIELGSFVRPDAVPAMADTPEVFAGIRRKRDVRYIGLVPNEKGLERALAVDTPTVAIFIGASNSFTRKNMNMTTAQALEQAELIARAARKAKVPVRGYISTCFECPYEGMVKPADVAKLVKALLTMKCYEVVISDTIGTAAPKEVHAVFKRLLSIAPANRFAFHAHNTRGMAVANVMAAVELGITSFDGSVGGLGGCPYAPGAAGNVATEDLVYLFDRMGVKTDIDGKRVEEIATTLKRRLA